MASARVPDAFNPEEGMLISWDLTFRDGKIECEYTLSEFVRGQHLAVVLAASCLVLLFQWLAMCILYLLLPTSLRNETTGVLLMIGLSALSVSAILDILCWVILRKAGFVPPPGAPNASAPVPQRSSRQHVPVWLVRACAEIASGPWLSLLWCASLLIGSLDISTALWLTCATPETPGRLRFVTCQVWAIGGAPASALITPGFFSIVMVLCSQRALPTVLAILAAFWVAIAQYIVFAKIGITAVQNLSYAFLIVQLISYSLFFCGLAAVREWTSRRFFRSNRLQQAGAARLQRFAELMSASSQLMFEMKPVYAVGYAVEGAGGTSRTAGDPQQQALVVTADTPVPVPVPVAVAVVGRTAARVQLPVDFHWRFLSQAVNGLLGQTSEELLDTSVLSSIHPDDVEGYMSSLQQALRGPTERPWVTQFRRVRPDGSTVMVESVAYIRMAAGPASASVPHIAYILGSERDVTAEVAARDSIGREREARLAAVSAAAAAESSTAYAVHELRNPLHGLAGGMEVLALGLAGHLTGQLKRDFSVVQAALASLRRLVDDILDTAKIKRGVITVSKQPVELRPLLEDLVRQYASFATVPLLLRVAPDVPGLVEIDPLRLRQCLSNAITNAAKHTTTGMILISVSVVAVSGDDDASRLGLAASAWTREASTRPRMDTSHAEDAGEHGRLLGASEAEEHASGATPGMSTTDGVSRGEGASYEAQPEPEPARRVALVFEIADTGHGLGGTLPEELFQDFVQAESAKLSSAGGTGLGLAIVRRIATAMRGIVSLHEARGYPLPAAFAGATIQATNTNRWSIRTASSPPGTAPPRFLVLGPGRATGGAMPVVPAIPAHSTHQLLSGRPDPATFPTVDLRRRSTKLMLSGHRLSTTSSQASGGSYSNLQGLASLPSTPAVDQSTRPWDAGPYVCTLLTDVYVPLGCPGLDMSIPAGTVPQKATVFKLVLPAVALSDPPTAQEAEASLRASLGRGSVATPVVDVSTAQQLSRGSSSASATGVAMSPGLSPGMSSGLSLRASPPPPQSGRKDNIQAWADTGSPSAGSSKADLSSWRVLLADDEQMNRSLGARLLKGAGVAQVDSVPDGEAAIAAVAGIQSIQSELQDSLPGTVTVSTVSSQDASAEHVAAPWGGYDAVLMDQTMPRMTGAQAAERLRALGCPLPMVAVTGTAVEADKLLLLRSGFDAVLLKPFGVSDLRRTLLQAAEVRLGVEARPVAKLIMDGTGPTQTPLAPHVAP